MSFLNNLTNREQSNELTFCRRGTIFYRLFENSGTSRLDISVNSVRFWLIDNVVDVESTSWASADVFRVNFGISTIQLNN